MKHLRKLLTLVVALVMTLGLVAPTMAEETPKEPDYDKPLKVTGLAEGDTVKFYQVIKWVGETTDKSDVSGWKAVSPFDTYLTKDKLTAILVGYPATPEGKDPETGETIPAKEAVPATGITSEIAGELAKLAKTGVDVATAKDGETYTATYQNEEAGMWMVLVTPKDAGTIYNPVFVSADYNKDKGHEGNVAINDQYSGDAVAKKSSIPLTKTAKNDADYNKDNAKTTAVGDTVTFEVTTAIPAYGNVYADPHFVLTDKLTDLKLKKDATDDTKYDVVVSGVPATYKDAEDTDQPTYTISATDAGYSVTFAPGYLKTLKAPVTNVKITYKAIVIDTALKAVNEEDNEVYIEFSHDPNKQDDYKMKKDSTQHYTFSIDAEGAGEGDKVKGKKTSEVVKIGVNADGTPITETTETSEITDTEKWTGPLEGAEFGLFTDQACTTPYKAKNADGTPGTTAMTATTGADGRMNFKGLDAGTYYLKELNAPAGYVTNSTVHTIVITAETETVEVTEWWNGTEWVSEKPASGTAKEVTYETEVLKSYKVTIDGQDTATYTFKNEKKTNSTDIDWETAELVEHPFELENTKGTELPSTGGMGTTLFYVVGTLLVLGAGVVLVSKRRITE